MEAAARDTITANEAALLAGVSHALVCRWAQVGDVAAVKVDRQWQFARDDVVACAAEKRSRGHAHRPVPHVDARPLLRQVELRGGAAACCDPRSTEWLALRKARQSGWLTFAAADQLAVRLLGLTPWELWDEVG